MLRRAILAACALAALLAPAAGATMRADLDPGGTLALTDAAGTADTLSLADANKGASFVTFPGGLQAGLIGVCALTSTTFHGYTCPFSASIRLDTGAGNDTVDASRLSTPLQATLGPGSDVLIAGSGADTVASVADGVRDVVECGPGQDTVQGVADPNDDLAASCESAQRSFAGKLLPSSVTVARGGLVTLTIGTANVPLSFTATMTTAPAKHGAHTKPKTITHAKAPAATGAVKLRFKLPDVSKGFLSKRPSLRVEVDVTAIGADGRHYPLSLHAQAPGSHPKLVTLHDNQVRLTLPASLRHPHGAH